jgi:preprotein translocase subunit SecF
MTLAIGDGMISSVYLFHRLSILFGKKKKRTKHKDKENEKERKITG